MYGDAAMSPAMTSMTTISSKTDSNIIAAIHKLKLQWIMAKDEAERRRISEEIRKRLSEQASK
jgi:hypothetical protein